MITRDVQLHTGLMLGSDRSTNAVIREEILDDELAVLESGHADMRLVHRRIMMRRVVGLGPLAPPSEEILRKITRTDWEVLEKAMERLDNELALDAGLIERAGDPGAGRDEPGGSAPGDASADPDPLSVHGVDAD